MAMGTRVDAFGVLKRSLLRFGVFLLLESGVVYAISWPRARYTGTLRQHRPFFGAQSLWTLWEFMQSSALLTMAGVPSPSTLPSRG